MAIVAPTAPPDPTGTSLALVGASDPRADLSAALQAGKDLMRLPYKSYDSGGWSAGPLNLDSFTGHPTKTLVLEGAGSTITTINTGGNPLFVGGDGWTILIKGCEFNGDARNGSTPICHFTNFLLFKAYDTEWSEAGATGLVLDVPNSARAGLVFIYSCVFDDNAVHGLELDGVGDFHLVKPIAQRNEYYGVYIHGNRGKGVIRGAHIEDHYGYVSSNPTDWGINLSLVKDIGVYEAMTFGGSRIWVDSSTCEVRNCGVTTHIAPYNNWAIDTGTTPSDTSMICGSANVSNNYDVARLHPSC